MKFEWNESRIYEHEMNKDQNAKDLSKPELYRIDLL